MRRFCKRALAVLTAAAMLSAGSSALAAEGDAGISVQLDGQTLTFSDAAPEARDGRTFLPVQAVFEASVEPRVMVTVVPSRTAVTAPAAAS